MVDIVVEQIAQFAPRGRFVSAAPDQNWQCFSLPSRRRWLLSKRGARGAVKPLASARGYTDPSHV